MALRGLVALALLGQAGAVARVSKKEGFAADLDMMDWSYYPPGAKIGIATGGPQELFTNMNYGSQAASLMLQYAQRHGYAFYVERNLQRLGPRKKYWNKVLLMHKLLREVPTLVWMDPEIVIQKLDTPLESLMDSAKCDGSAQDHWNRLLPKQARADTVLFLNEDKRPREDAVNANTAFIVLRQSTEAFALLSKVWNAGEGGLELHKDSMRWLSNRTAVNGWDTEQGAFWEVLAQEPETFLPKSCIAAGTHFHGVRFGLSNGGQFAQSFAGATDSAARSGAKSVLQREHIHPQVH